eukprot:gene2673-5260_t
MLRINYWTWVFATIAIYNANPTNGADSKTTRICVIGSGVSASTFTLFLRREIISTFNLERPEVTIDMYERSILSGRVRSISFQTSNGEKIIELGAAIFHLSNYYMKTISSILYLTISKPSRTNSLLGLYNGNQIIFQSHPWSLLTQLSMIWRYGIVDIFKVRNAIQNIANKFYQLYNLQHGRDLENLSQSTTASNSSMNMKNILANSKQSFQTVESLLKAVDLYNLTQISIEEYLVTEIKLSTNSKFLRELITAAIRVNYNQNLTINALVGAIGLIPLIIPELFIIEEGNDKISHKIIENHIDNIFIQHNIQNIHFNNLTQKFTISGENSNHCNKCQHNNDRNDICLDVEIEFDGDCIPTRFSIEYDKVVIATPLSHSNITFSGLSSTSIEHMKDSRREYKHTHVTFIEGNINRTFFGYNDNKIPFPATFLTSYSNDDNHNNKNKYNNDNKNKDNNALDSCDSSKRIFTSIGTYYEDIQRNYSIYKIFSEEALNNTHLSCLFYNIRNITTTIDWLAYPKYSSKEIFSSFEIQSNLFYINAFESAVSCMECMTIAAKNVALLVAEEMQKDYSTTSTESTY